MTLFLMAMTFLGVLALGGATVMFVILPELLSSGSIAAQRTIVTATDPTLAQNHVLLLVTTPERKKTFYWLDGTEKISVPGGYGEYELRAAVALLALEKKNERQFRTGLSYALSTVITDVVATDTWEGNLVADIERQPLGEQTKQLSQYFYAKALRALPDLQTARQYFKLYRFFDHFISLHSSVPVLKPSDLAEALKNTSLVPSQQTQQCPVAIINTTEVAGLATQVTGLVEQGGALVVRSEHEAQDSPHTTILTSAESAAACSDVLSLLDTVFPNGAPQTQIDNDSLLTQYRAKIVVLLGDDMGEYYR